MLTTTLDGLWVLQVLTGLEVLAPELGLRPHLPSVESRQMALLHPAAGELRTAGVIDEAGTVDEAVREWLTVLSRRDIAVLLYAQTPHPLGEPERILLARFCQWWVTLERFETQVRLSAAGTAGDEQSAGVLIGSQIERLCGAMKPAVMKPVTIDTAELLAAVDDSASLRAFLLDRELDSDQVAILSLAADHTRSAQASIVAIQGGTEGAPARSHVDSGVVTIIDTHQGRIVSERVQRGGKSWMIVGPGAVGNISAAVLSLLRNLPAHEQWSTYRKVV